jgi:hypothetical protein
VSDAVDAAKALAELVPVGLDDPRVQEFAEAVVADIAVRPSPRVEPESLEDRVSRIESKLDDVIRLLSGGPP